MYKVIKPFVDLQDNDFAYEIGDKFPRDGADVSEDRIKSLSTSDNRQCAPLIKKIDNASTRSLDPATPAQSMKKVEQEAPPKRISNGEEQVVEKPRSNNRSANGNGRKRKGN